MCDNPLSCYLVKYPKRQFRNFFICTRQYREVVQLEKEYLLFGSGIEKYGRRFDFVQEVFVPCGKCIQCLNSRSKSWEIRSILEKNRYKDCCCLTLTYDDEHLPKGPSFIQTLAGLFHIPYEKRGVINYKDVQDFVKRLRKSFNFKKKIRYFCSCEYGSSGTLRPHYHIILFGYKPYDIDPTRTRISKKGTVLYKSPSLDKLWSKGFVDVGIADNRACRYVAQYCCKGLLKKSKMLSPSDKFILDIKNKVAREGLHASIGLGLETFKEKYHTFISESKIMYGKFTYAIPRYFVKKLEEICPRLYNEYKARGHDYWLSFKLTDDMKRKLKAKSENLLRKLNLFHSDMFNCLAS